MRRDRRGLVTLRGTHEGRVLWFVPCWTAMVAGVGFLIVGDLETCYRLVVLSLLLGNMTRGWDD